VGLVTIIGLILLIIPGIIFAIWYAFAVYINIIETKDNKGWDALKRSKELVAGRWGATFWRIMIPALSIYLLSMIVVIGLMFMFTGGQINFEDSMHIAIYNTVTTIIFLALAPLFTSFYIILYNNLKETKKTSSASEE